MGTKRSEAVNERIENHPVLPDLPVVPEVGFIFDGRRYTAREGEPVAVALLAAGVRTLRRSPAWNEPRGLYCGIGHCYECRLWLGDHPETSERVRACQTAVRDGDVYRSTREEPE